MDTPRRERIERFRTAIAGFIEARREAKLKGKEEDADAASRYDYGTWLADAAERAKNLQVVTHPIKFTHSAIKGASSAYIGLAAEKKFKAISTRDVAALDEDFAITDAKHLDVYSLLKEVVDDRQLLGWLRDNDDDLRSALSDNPTIATGLMEKFRQIFRQDKHPISHPLAKQVYWLVGGEPSDDGQYHLLQPMFSSSLESVTYSDIRQAREAAFAARGTSKQKPTFAEHYTYPSLVARKIGGENAQNVSPKNKARGGTNYLLASLPPVWAFRQAPQLLRQESALESFRWFGNVPELLRSLGAFLQSDPDNIMETRDRREAMEQALGDELAMFAATVREQHPPGWTRDEACRLPRCEQLWLDSERSELPVRNNPEHPAWKDDDEAFNQAYANGDWADEVATRFGLWLNKLLRERHTKLVTLGEAEMRHWARCAHEVLA